MLTEEHLQDAVKCDGSRARCKECWMLNYMGQDDCVRRLAETAIKLKAELETEKALHHKCEKLALKNAMGYDEVKDERDAAIVGLNYLCSYRPNADFKPSICGVCRYARGCNRRCFINVPGGDNCWEWVGTERGDSDGERMPEDT